VRKKEVAMARVKSPAKRTAKRGIPSVYLINGLERKRIYRELWKI
jgi:hypothetical protein